jgi:membrane associated rhomboid family serine protease
MSFKDRLLNIPPITKNLLIINIIVFIAGQLVPHLGMLIEQYGALYYFTSDQFLPWQLISYMFLHGSFLHLFFNMFSLWMFGEIIERSLGPQKYLLYYISCGLGAALIQEGVFALMINHYAGLFENGTQLCHLLRNSTVTTYEVMDLGIMPDEPAVHSIFNLYHTATVGASGAIYGILLAFGFLFPYMRIYLMFPPIPMRARTAILVFAAIELFLGVYNSQADTVAHFAHLGGMLIGFLILFWWKKKGTIRTFY